MWRQAWHMLGICMACSCLSRVVFELVPEPERKVENISPRSGNATANSSAIRVYSGSGEGGATSWAVNGK